MAKTRRPTYRALDIGFGGATKALEAAMDSQSIELAADPAVRIRVTIDIGCSCYPLLINMEESYIQFWVRAAIEFMAFALHGENPRAKRLMEESQRRRRTYLPRTRVNAVGEVIKVRVRITKPRFAYRYVVGLKERDSRAWVHNALDFMAFCLLENANSEPRRVTAIDTPAPAKRPIAAERKQKAPKASEVSNASNIGVDKDDFLAMLGDPSRWA